MKKLITGILLLINIICYGQFDCPDGMIVGNATLIDSISISGGVLTHYEGTSTDKSQFKYGIILNGVYIDSISNSSGNWIWYKGISASGKFNAPLGISVGSSFVIDSVHVTGSDIDSLYILGISYFASNASYYYVSNGIDIGQSLWTITDITREEDSLLITINDTISYKIIGDSSLAFVNRSFINSPDTFENAPFGLMVEDNLTKIQYVNKIVDSLNMNINGWLFKILPPPLPPAAPDPFDVFTVSPHNRGDTAITVATGYDATADSFRLNYVTGLTPPATRTSGTLILADDDPTLFNSRLIYIDVPDDNTNYAFTLWSGKSNIWNSNSDTVQLDSIGPLPEGYCDEFQDIYDAYATPPHDSIADKFNTFVKALVDGNVWSELDVMYVFATNNATDALINWINPGTYNATNINSTSFIAWEGFTSDGSYDYIDLNWNPYDNGVNYTSGDASLGIYIRTNLKADLVEIGASDGTNTTMIQAAYNNGPSSDFYLRLNSEGYSFVYNTNNASGMKIITRTTIYLCPSYNNKTQYLIDNGESDSPDADMYVCCWNLSGTASDFSHNQISFVFAGGSLTQIKVNIITNAWETFMDSNGKGIIP